MDNIKTWEDISMRIQCDYYSLLEFILLYKSDDKYLIVSDEDLKNLNYHYIKYYLLPCNCFSEIKYHTWWQNFDSYRQYHIIKYLYIYKNDYDTCKLLLFTNALYYIIKNDLYYCFEECQNYNADSLESTMKNILSICENEILTRLGIKHRLIYRQTRINFSPVEMIDYRFKHINKCLDISNVNVLIDYISLIIKLIKSEYYFVVVYNRHNEKSFEVLNRL